MESTDRIGEDLEYVRGVVARTRGGAAPRSIWYLWAAISFVGLAMTDFAPERVGIFWLVAGPAGFVASMALGWRSSRAAGVESRRDADAHMLHWGGMMLAIFLLVPLAATGPLSGPAMGQAVLVIVALGYFLAGVHMARPFMWVAPLVAAGYGLTFLLDQWAWTIAGALVALGLVVTARVSARA
ncbi:MAG TPA: hypothetical protein VM778_04455 [Gemmatimonadota bacterium]|nr:hypothetical protein [Gemmatimonadota bacterium]